jgi:hypothetical protein
MRPRGKKRPRNGIFLLDDERVGRIAGVAHLAWGDPRGHGGDRCLLEAGVAPA